MRLNDGVTPEGRLTESKQFLEETVERFVYNPPAPISRTPDASAFREIAEFYERHYVPLDARGHLPVGCRLPGDTNVSSYEDKVLDFCTAPNSETRICVLHGHTGVGKTTLLRRVIYYIYWQSPHLKGMFFPVYLRLTPDIVGDGEANIDSMHRRIVRALCESAYPVLRKNLLRSSGRMLRALNEQGPFNGNFPDEVIEQVLAQGVEVWMRSFFSTGIEREEFLLEAIKLLTRLGKLRLVLVVDDVDRHSEGIHTGVFLTLDTLATFGIASLVSMRTSTFFGASLSLLEYRDRTIELRLNPDLIQQILTHRLDVARTLPLKPDIQARIPQYEQVTQKDVVSSFCSFVSHPTCTKALVGLSNTNIKSIFRKLELMTRSETFSDAFIVHLLMERDALGPGMSRQSKIWIFYHLLLGNWAGTYRSNREVHKAGLVNIFDCLPSSANPWKHFVQFNLLVYLYKVWRLVRDTTLVSVNELHERFKCVFLTTVENSLFVEALYTLIESELVFAGSCRKYSRERMLQDIFADTIMLSDAGRFYLENLLHKVEYLYFVKDDIDWREEVSIEHLKLARRDYDRQVKFADVLNALHLLLREEYYCLGKLKAYWHGHERAEDALARYRDHFSPYGLLGTRSISYCSVILRSYKEFMERRLGASYATSDASSIIAEMERFLDENDAIRQAYVQA